MITFVPNKSKFEEGYTRTRFFNIHEEIIIQSTQQNSHQSLGFVDGSEISSYRKNPRNKILKHVEIPSDSEIIAFLKIYKGISPYDPEDQWKKKMFNWDIFTHKYENRYVEELRLLPNEEIKTFNNQKNEEWKIG